MVIAGCYALMSLCKSAGHFAVIQAKTERALEMGLWRIRAKDQASSETS